MHQIGKDLLYLIKVIAYSDQVFFIGVQLVIMIFFSAPMNPNSSCYLCILCIIYGAAGMYYVVLIWTVNLFLRSYESKWFLLFLYSLLYMVHWLCIMYCISEEYHIIYFQLYVLLETCCIHTKNTKCILSVSWEFS